MKFKKKTKETIKEIIFLLVITLLAIFFGLVLEIFIGFLPLIYMTISLSLLLIGYAIIKKNFMKKHEKVIIPLTNILFAFFMLMAFFTAYQTYKITDKNYEIYLSANKPKLAAQLTTNDIPWGHFIEDYNHTVWENKKSAIHLELPLYLSVHNFGTVPTLIYNVRYDTTCGNSKGLLSFPQNTSRVIKPGDFFKMSDTIFLSSNSTMRDILPCKIDFWIYSPNYDTIHKTITLVEGKL